jgi:hypothetical protein
MRQAVTLTGLSTEAFAAAASACEEISTTMRAHFPEEATNAWQNGLYEGHITIDFNARYFTLRKNAPTEANLPFSEGIDPHGILAAIRKQDLIHGADNQVAYLKALENEMCAST